MGDKKFRAFISYSHADDDWGAWLQRALERFRAPKSLARALEASGCPTRLSPAFRDREDFPVAGDLNAAIKAALADSEYQIVLCSPASAKSRWVNEEIKLFHKLHGPGRVFAVIVGGAPGASAITGREAEECFPPALRMRLDEAGETTNIPAELLAADAREEGDGKRYAILKVAAGMLGVGLDDLVRRDAARRTRIATTIAVASAAGAGVFAFATVAAVTARNEATLMRGKAENLIEFMLTDLKDRLEPVGRLDVLESVGDQAMAYYADQDLESLDDAALARRAKAMILLGNIDFKRNDLASAQSAYEVAEQATEELLRRSPTHTDRIFDHAQAVFYVGEASLAAGDAALGEKQYNEYLRLAEQLVQIDPNSSKWRLEVAYATSNLGGVKFAAGQYGGSLVDFKHSARIRQELLKEDPGNREMELAYAYALSWQAFSELMIGHYAEVIALTREQLGIYGEDALPTSENFSTLLPAVTARRRLAEALIGLNRLDEARDAARGAAEAAARLIGRDAEIAMANLEYSYIEQARSLLLEIAGDAPGAVECADRAIVFVDAVARHELNDERAERALAAALASRLRLGGEPARLDMLASRLDQTLSDLLVSSSPGDYQPIAAASLALARHAASSHRNDRANEIAAAAAGLLEPRIDALSISTKFSLAGLLLEIGAIERATLIVAPLQTMGVAHPELAALANQIQGLDQD